MPDWKQLDWDKKVRERMARLNLPANSKDAGLTSPLT